MMATSTNQHARQELDRKDSHQGAGVFWLFFLLAVGCVIAILNVAVVRSVERANEFAVLMELEQIGYALEQYKREYGVYPPNAESSETTTHLQLRLKGQEIDEFASIKSLDEDEVLLFWLGDAGSRCLAKTTHNVPFLFVDKERLTDVDEDGFAEYTSGNDSVFIIRNGQAMCKDRNSANVVSAKGLRSNQSKEGG